jgi:polyisoprenyl-teichoic acid--peptidoglycan teichoic acid transferase
MVDVPSDSAAALRPHRPWLAAVLSFAFPGLGQAYSGRWRDALVFGVPVLLLLVAGVALVSGMTVDRNHLLSAGFLAAVMTLNVILLAWRLAAIAHAGLTPTRLVRGPRRRVAGATVVGLVVLSVAMHAWVGVVVAQLETTLGQVFAGDPDPDPDPAKPPAGPDDPAASPSPDPTSWTGADQLNVLLIGTDAAPGREAALTDVILVLSIDPADGRAVMISVPRDTGWLPLPDERLFPDGRYPGKVNEIAAQAESNAEMWCPDLVSARACGLRTLQQAVGLYIGQEIHHYALVDMVGFAGMIDAIGGLELCLPGRLIDPAFDGSLDNTNRTDALVLPAGCHHYSGIDALAYARSRMGWIELPDGTIEHQSDFHRNERQQQVLLALRRELAAADTLFELPGLIRAIGRTVTTDLPRDRAGDLAGLLPLITGPDIDRVVLGYPEFVDLAPEPDVYYILVPKREAIRDEMSRLFGRDQLVGWYLATWQPTPSSGPPGPPGP